MVKTSIAFLFAGIALSILFSFDKPVDSKNKIIGHRGGVVDSSFAENSLAALQQAYKRGYYMVEIDIRLSKDSQLMTQHDPDFKKYYGTASTPQQLNWDQIKKLHNNKDGGQPLLLEEVFQYCSGKMQVMLDNKITGNDTATFHRIENLLRQYKLIENAMIIGTSEIREYFLNKTNVGLSRTTIESLEKKNKLDPKKLFLFEHGNILIKNDIDWATSNGIMVVPTINKFHYTKEPYMEGAARDIRNLKQWNVQFFQIDSEFDQWLK